MSHLSFAAPPVLGDRLFLLFLLGTMASVLGNASHIIAAALILLHLTGTAASVPVIAILGTIPAIALSGMVGRVVDRWSRLGSLILIDLISACVALIVPSLSVLGWLEPWHVYAQELLLAIASAFYLPATKAFLREILPEDQLLSGNAVLVAGMQVAGVLGWTLGGAFIAITSPSAAMVANAISFLISASAMIVIGLHKSHRLLPVTTSSRIDVAVDLSKVGLGATLRRTLHDRYLRSVVAMVVALVLCQRLMFSMFIAFMSQHLHASPAQIGFVNSTFSLGAIVGSLIIVRLAARNLSHRMTKVYTVAFFASALGFAVAPDVRVALLWYLIVGATAQAVIMLQTEIQLHVEIDMQGRVFAAVQMVQAVANVVGLGALTLALLAADIQMTYLVVLFLLAAITAYAARGLRDAPQVLTEQRT